MIPWKLLNGDFSNCFHRYLIHRRFVSRLPAPPGKPPLIPPAKTKRYRIQHVPWQDANDVQELLWRRHAYNDALNTYRAWYKGINEEQMKSATGQAAIQQREDEEFDQVLRENEAKNHRIAEKRKIRIEERIQRLEEETFAQVEELIKSEQRAIQDAEAEVLAMKDRSKDFITLENMEEKILEALERPKEYNYALDSKGNVYQGDVYLKYLTETPLASVPVSETTAPLRKVGVLEVGTGRIVKADEDVAASARS